MIFARDEPELSSQLRAITTKFFNKNKLIFANLGQIKAIYLMFYLFSHSSGAIAQIIPDTTLPINSQVIPNGNTLIIEGGTTAGSNLFHSFEQFGISTGAVAAFNNGTGIENIISRITGNSLSNINGEIRANGTANLFLLNPNGIIFGSNGRLNIGGSFFASTAERLNFADGTQFSVKNSQSSPLLTVSVPVGLQYGSNPGSIINQSRALDNDGNLVGLQVPTGKSLGLIGGQVVVAGGHLNAPQGRIELGSVGDRSFVSLTPVNVGFALGYEGVRNFQDIRLSERAGVNASGEGGGNIQIQGGQVTLTEGANLVSDTFGSINGGDILINAEQLQVEGGAFVGAATFGSGAGGDIIVRASESVKMRGFSIANYQLTFILSSLSGTRRLSDRQTGGLFTGTADNNGRAGDIAIDTMDLVLENGAVIAAESLGKGAGGNLQIAASNSVELIGSNLATRSIIPDIPLLGANRAPSGLSTTGIPAGDAGDITINTQRLIIQDESIISAGTLSDGAGGDILIKASESVKLLEIGGFLVSPAGITSLTVGGTGAGGNITIDTGKLIVRDGGVIATNSGAPVPGGTLLAIGGQGGSVTVKASELVELTGSAANGIIPSSLNSRTFTAAPAGEIRILTGRLLVQDGGQVSTTTANQGHGGTVVVNAESIELFGSSLESKNETGLFSASGDIFFNPSATGTAGDLKIATDKLVMRDGAVIAANSLGSGNAGILEITANSLWLDRQGKIIATTTSGEGGNIKLQVRDILQLRNNSLISAEAGGTGNGGNIDINAKFILAVPQENSDIIANAFQGKGGNINITAHSIFGFELQQKLTPLSDITASSEFGLEGVVTIAALEIDPSQGIVVLPSDFGVPEPLEGCQSRQGRSHSSFVNTGRGGLPSNPIEPLSSIDILEDIQLPAPWAEHSQASDNPNQIVEAQGWFVNEQGQVVLSEQVPPKTNVSCRLTQSAGNSNSEPTKGSVTTQL